RIAADGWQIVTDCPVRFIRKHGMLALPVPVAGGSVDALRKLVNLPDDDAWRLYVAWIVAAFRPGRPFPILALNGEQGSAKSTACKMARALMDPNKSPLRRPPREDRDLLIAATNAWIVAFDNLSGLSPALSDALCMLATGGGEAGRKAAHGGLRLLDRGGGRGAGLAGRRVPGGLHAKPRRGERAGPGIIGHWPVHAGNDGRAGFMAGHEQGTSHGTGIAL